MPPHGAAVQSPALLAPTATWRVVADAEAAVINSTARMMSGAPRRARTISRFSIWSTGVPRSGARPAPVRRAAVDGWTSRIPCLEAFGAAQGSSPPGDTHRHGEGAPVRAPSAGRPDQPIRVVMSVWICAALRALLNTRTSSILPLNHSPQMALPPILRGSFVAGRLPVIARLPVSTPLRKTRRVVPSNVAATWVHAPAAMVCDESTLAYVDPAVTSAVGRGLPLVA